MLGLPLTPTRDGSWRAHGTTLIWTVFVGLALFMPGDGLQPDTGLFPWTLPEGTDKLIHSFLFFFEALFLYRSLRLLESPWPPLPTAIGAAILLGALTEWAQLSLPDRSGDLGDWIADILGALACGAWVSRPAAMRSKSPSRKLPE
ncbi:MAG: VanZ family protein [Acidobacteriota bacterium]